MFATISRRIASWVSKKDRVYLLLGVLCLLGSVTLTAHALLTVSNSGLLGDGAVTIDGAGVLNLGTASSTAVVIGNSGIPVTIPGTLTLGSASSTGQLIFRNASTSFTTTLQASSSQASNLTLTLAPTLGTSGQAMLTDGTGNLYFGNVAPSQWLSGASGTIYYNSGNVGINTSTPTALLSLVGSSSSPASLFNISSSSGASLFNVSGNGTVTVGTRVPGVYPSGSLAVADNLLGNGSGSYGTPLTSYDNYIAYGDSLTAGVQANSPQGTNGFAGQIATTMGIPLNTTSRTGYVNRGRGGAEALDIAHMDVFPNQNPTNTSNTVYTLMVGTNEAKFNSSNPDLELHYNLTLPSSLSWLSIPRSYKVFAQDAGCAQAGTWTADVTYQTGIGLNSITNGSTLTCTITTSGGPIYAWYRRSKEHTSDLQSR